MLSGLFVKGQLHAHQLPLPVYGHNCRIPGLVVPQRPGEHDNGAHIGAAHIDQNVACADACSVRRTAGHHLGDFQTGRQAVGLRHGGVHLHHHHSHISAGDVAVPAQVGNLVNHIVHGDSKADALNGGPAFRVAGVLGGGNAHHLPVHIEQRAAGIAGVDGGVGLNHIDGLTVGGNHPVLGADIAYRHGGGELAQGIAHRHHLISHLEGIAAAQLHAGQVLGVHLQHRHIVAAVKAHHPGRIFQVVPGDDT